MLVTRDYETKTPPMIARAANADTDGPALVLTESGNLYRIGTKAEKVATKVRCMGPAGAIAKVVTDEGIMSVAIDKTTQEGPAIAGLSHCGVGADGNIVAITSSGIERQDGSAWKNLGPLPSEAKAPVAINADVDGVVWVLDVAKAYALKNGAWVHETAAISAERSELLLARFDGAVHVEGRNVVQRIPSVVVGDGLERVSNALARVLDIEPLGRAKHHMRAGNDFVSHADVTRYSPGPTYRLDFDLGDSVDAQMKPSCPPAKAGGKPPPCKIPGIESRPPRNP